MIIEYKNLELAKISKIIHAAFALAGGAIFKMTEDQHEFSSFFIIAMALAVVSYAYWYLANGAGYLSECYGTQHRHYNDWCKRALCAQSICFYAVAISYIVSLIGLWFAFNTKPYHWPDELLELLGFIFWPIIIGLFILVLKSFLGLQKAKRASDVIA